MTSAGDENSSRGGHPLRIGVVCQYFLPENAPIPVTVPFELADRGHSVRVVTGFPNYPSGKLFKGYRQRFGVTEIHGDVLVRRVPLWISHSRNPIGRILNYLSFGLSSFAASRFLKDVDVIYVYATQMTAAMAPVVWRRTRRTPFVLHVQDLWPESVTGSGMVGDRLGRVIAVLLRPWLGFAYRTASATISIAPTMTKTLVDRGVPAERANTVFNWAPAEASDAVDRPAAWHPQIATEELRVVYAGNIGEMQDLDNVMKAFALVRDLQISLDVFGDGVDEDRIRALAEHLELTRVVFHGRVAGDEMALRSEAYDFQLVPLKDLPLFRMTIPSKFQASISRGVPVITTVAGDLSDLVAEYGVGYSAAPGDPESLAEVLCEALRSTPEQRAEMRGAAAKLYEGHMSLETSIGRLESILISAAQDRERRPHQTGDDHELRK